VLLISALLIAGCKKDDKINFTKDKISGYSQKGPFVNGSTLTLFELDENFNQTGNTFETFISNNSGVYELSDIALNSQYAKLKAYGYYFNEVLGNNSTGPISLYAISDLSDKSTVNVNILTTLETPRVEFLVSQGVDFNTAKHQAQQEVLAVFGYTMSNNIESEVLNISSAGSDNAMLLAMSVIVQGFRTDAELTQLMAELSADLRTDGVLSDFSIGSELMNAAMLVDTTQIRQNLADLYSQLGVNATIPPFESYISHFINTAAFPFTAHVLYPSGGIFGINVLNTTDSVFASGSNLSMCANIPNGAHLKIKYYNSSGIAILGYSPGTLDGWISMGGYPVCEWQSDDYGLVDAQITVADQGTITIEIFENNSITPTRTKIITVQ